MTRYFIKVRNGEACDHPIIEANFDAAFPDVDKDNLPEGFMDFVRVEQPDFSVYQKNIRCEYQLVDGVMTDVWLSDEMDGSEKLALQDERKAAWAVNGFASWAFNADSCLHEPPVAYPDDGLRYFWDEETLSWVEVPSA